MAEHKSRTSTIMAAPTLSLLQSLTITTLTLVSFIFTILGITTEHWASAAQYTSPTKPPSINNRHLEGYSLRGPFKSCPLLQNATTSVFSNLCTSGTCIRTDNVQFGGPWWCQQLITGANLIIAGCVFTGIGFVSCAVSIVTALVAGLTARQTRSDRREAGMIFGMWRTFTALTLVLAVGTTGVGWAIATEVLVNQQKFDGDFLITGPFPVNYDHWTMGKGVVYGAVGWIPSLVAILLLPSRPMHGRRTAEEQ